MHPRKSLYPSFNNPFLIQPDRAMPDEIAVIGAGNIGPDIAYFLRTGLPEKKLYLVDVQEDQLKKAEKRFQGYARKAIDYKKLSEEQAEAVLNNIVYTTEYNRLAGCGLIIEAATENLDLKRRIFANLEAIVDENAILSSNTSSIPADQIFSGLKHPERNTITHFFAPAWRSMAVEVINWEGVQAGIIDFLLWFFANAGKAPIVTRNVYSFLLNRIFENWTNEAVYLVGPATARQIDAVTEEFVEAGPFFVLDMSGGNPLIYESQTRRISERACYAPSPILLSIAKWNTARPGTPVDIPSDLHDWIRNRMLGVIFSQCFDIADRNIGTRSDLNFGSLIGLGFKRGVFDIMADLGEQAVRRIVDRFDKERPGFPRPKGFISDYFDFPRDILVDAKDGVRIITIRRPQAANALGPGTCDEILGELKKGEGDPSVKGFVITGYGTQAFCTGADIGGFIAAFDDRKAGVAPARGNSEVPHFIDRMDKPVVAAVNGSAMSGGAELAFLCHSMVADQKAFFQLSEITPESAPGMDGAEIPYRKWPHATEIFHAMIGQAKRLTAQEAKELGMLKQITTSYPELIAAAIAEVQRLQVS